MRRVVAALAVAACTRAQPRPPPIANAGDARTPTARTWCDDVRANRTDAWAPPIRAMLEREPFDDKPIIRWLMAQPCIKLATATAIELTNHTYAGRAALFDVKLDGGKLMRCNVDFDNEHGKVTYAAACRPK